MAGGLPEPRGVSWSTVRVGKDELLLIEFPLPVAQIPPGLTRAECAVVRLLLADHAPEEIARTRRTSVNTVRNQIRNAYRKLGVSNTAELAQLCFAPRQDEPR